MQGKQNEQAVLQEKKAKFSMERIDHLQKLPVFMEMIEELECAEKDRVFCTHTLDHFLDVARLMWISVLENDMDVHKDMVYAAALLHDLGRLSQIKDGISHDKASASLAGELLPACGYTKSEVSEIQDAILSHRGEKKAIEQENADLASLLYQADKKSRNCYHCSASSECNWKKEKRTYQIR